MVHDSALRRPVPADPLRSVGRRGLVARRQPTGPVVGPASGTTRRAALFVVHLDGIGKTGPQETRMARALIGRVRDTVPDAVLLTHVMPYTIPHRGPAVSGRPVLTYLNNALQLLAACESRHRATYGRDVARSLALHLAEAGYRRGVPLVLIGYSGGTQAAATAAGPLAAALGGPPMTIISIGGFHDGVSDLRMVSAVHVVTSTADVFERMATLLFPGRWRWWPVSGWHEAVRRGVVHVHDLSPARHVGRRGYLGEAMAEPGRTYLDRTVDVLATILAGAALDPPGGPRT